MSSADTPPQTHILAVLFSRGDGTFHWAIVVPSTPMSEMADMFHALNEGGLPNWRYEWIRRNVFKSGTRKACVAVKIGTVASTRTDTLNRLDDLLKRIPMLIPLHEIDTERIFTCRVWFKEAIRVLHQNGILSCPDVYALENELKYYGTMQDCISKSATGWQPT